MLSYGGVHDRRRKRRLPKCLRWPPTRIIADSPSSRIVTSPSTNPTSPTLLRPAHSPHLRIPVVPAPLLCRTLLSVFSQYVSVTLATGVAGVDGFAVPLRLPARHSQGGIGLASDHNPTPALLAAVCSAARVWSPGAYFSYHHASPALTNCCPRSKPSGSVTVPTVRP